MHLDFQLIYLLSAWKGGCQEAIQHRCTILDNKICDIECHCNADMTLDI